MAAPYFCYPKMPTRYTNLRAEDLVEEIGLFSANSFLLTVKALQGLRCVKTQGVVLSSQLIVLPRE